jgi:predicted nucleic acid-binding protein
MSLYEEAVAAAVKLPQNQREELAKALGLKLAPGSQVAGLPMVSATARVDATAWRKAETGHAVLATEVNLRDDEIPAGPHAIRGIWSYRGDELLAPQSKGQLGAADMPVGAPVVLHFDVALALACGDQDAISFFDSPGVEIRLATAGYLALLGTAENGTQQRRVRRFVQPFAVLSLGPMASSRAVELMLEHPGLSPLDALIAATAIAHEIPLLARDAERFVGIQSLTVGAV